MIKKILKLGSKLCPCMKVLFHCWWIYAVPIGIVMEFTSFQGNQVDWNLSNWTVSNGVDIREEEMSTLCKDDDLLGKLVWSKKISYDKFSQLCIPIGNIPTPMTIEDLRTESSNIKVNCKEINKSQ